MPFSEKIFFDQLNSQERIFLVIRKHWVVLAIRLLFLVIMLSIVLVAEAILKATLPELADGPSARIIDLVLTVLLIVFSLGLLSVWTMYYLNVQIITNERIIDVNQRSLLHHETSELNLDRVQDVTADIHGLLPNLFDYGTVSVQTAGEVENFVFESVPRPHQVARLILALFEKMQAEKQPHPAAPKPPVPKN